MKIQDSALQYGSSRQSVEYTRTVEKLKFWTGDRPAQSEQTPVKNGAPPDARDKLDLQIKNPFKEIGRDIIEKINENLFENGFSELDYLKHGAKKGGDCDSCSGAANSSLDYEMQIIARIVKELTGFEMKLFAPDEYQKAADAAAETQRQFDEARNADEGWGLEYDRSEIRYESETTRVDIGGVVKTADGKEISFNLSLEMTREFTEERSVSIRAGNAVRKDPLVINYDGAAADLTDSKYLFDVDADGKKDSVSFVKPGSAFLTFDKNDDGKVNDGGELFGAKTGDGFAELSAYDDDKNGWIDESDKVYDDLRLWSKNSRGEDSLDTLKRRNIGAINLKSVYSPFAIKSNIDRQYGETVKTGVFLRENGSAGTVQQLNLFV